MLHNYVIQRIFTFQVAEVGCAMVCSRILRWVSKAALSKFNAAGMIMDEWFINLSERGQTGWLMRLRTGRVIKTVKSRNLELNLSYSKSGDNSHTTPS